MSIDNFCFENTKFVRKHAIRLSQKNRIDYSDLMQEGMLSLVQLYRSNKLEKIAKYKHIKYINLTIRGTMLKHISDMSGAVHVDHNKFYNKEFVSHTYFDTDNQIDATFMPQDLALLMKENSKIFTTIVCDLIPTFSKQERFVWYEIMVAEEPMTTRDAAAFLKYKSCGSITFLKKKILNKLRRCML